MTTIIHNGNWPADQPKPLEALLDLLAREPLDPTHEPFAMNSDTAVVLFLGNFHTVSHPFSIETDDPAVCAQLIEAIKANRRTVAYAEAKAVCNRWTRGQDYDELVRRLANRRFRNSPRLSK